MVNFLPFGTSDNLVQCILLEKNRQFGGNGGSLVPAVLKFTVLYSCYLQNTINFILTTLRQIVSPNAFL